MWECVSSMEMNNFKYLRIPQPQSYNVSTITEVLTLRTNTHVCKRTQGHVYKQSLATNTFMHTHSPPHTHKTVLCTLTPLHRSHFTATPEIKFHWQRRAAEEEGERGKTERGRKTEERQKERERGYRSVGVGSIWD